MKVPFILTLLSVCILQLIIPDRRSNALAFRCYLVLVKESFLVGLIKHTYIFLNVFVENTIVRYLLVGFNQFGHLGL